MVSWRERVRRLELIVASKDAILVKRDEEIKLLRQHVLHLEEKLRKYISENTPSSQKPAFEKKSPERTLREKKPLGKPKGSPGGTRVLPEKVDEVVVRLEDEEKYFGKPVNYVEKIIAEIPCTQLKWTRYWLAQYVDPNTKDFVTATHPNIPSEGMFGPNARSLIVLLREKLKVSEGNLSEFFESMYGLKISPATIEAEFNRAAKILTPHYEQIANAISQSPVKHSDETGQSMNGTNWCLYGMSTQQHSFFFADAKKRAEHVKEKLKDDKNNVLVCDGHSIYNWYGVKQRCWSHLIRKEAWLLQEKETEERLMLHNLVSGTFKRANNILDTGPPSGPEQIWNTLFLRNRLWQAVKYDWQDPKCMKVAAYIKNGWKSWFTFMLVTGVPPTNNLCERDIRKHVMKRKNTGCFRSVQGLNNHCVILSVLETWTKQSQNPYHILIETLKHANSKTNLPAA